MEKILIIDDSLLQAESLLQILEQDYSVELCHNGPDGMKKAIAFQPSLILLDVIMPEMNGFEVLHRLKENEKTKDIPVIIITSLSDSGNEEKGLTMGAVDYIIKPFRPTIVKARVKTHTELAVYRRTIEQLAMLDCLTGLPNRRSYESRSQLEWSRCMRNQQPLSIGLLDIDYFKQYNDNYGHPKGDEALRQVTMAIRGKLRRASDFAARYGGEEFIFILPETPCAPGERLAREICMEVENLQIPHAHSKASGFITVSIGGITIVPPKGAFFSAALDIVDTMLYQAKGNGRNNVCWKALESL